jgi:tellurite resistance protein TerC
VHSSTPWIAFHLALLVLLAAEYALHRAVPNAKRKAIYAMMLWVAAALVLAALLLKPYGHKGALEYLAGYALEQSLSIDNLIVFMLLFRVFSIPAERQPKVLFWGVAGAIVMRGVFIAGGLGLLRRFHWIEYVFAVLLLFAAVRLLKPTPADESAEPPGWLRWLKKWHPISERQDAFVVRESVGPGGRLRWMATVLLLSLVAVELTDIVFALDSIPAVLSVTRVPFLAYTSNIMAVMSLRSLYVLLAAALSRLRFIHYGVAALLVFAATKMLAADWIDIGPLLSLGIIAALIAVTVAASLLIKNKPPRETISL